MEQHRLESMSVQDGEPQRNNYITTNSVGKFVSDKPSIRDLRSSSSQPNNIGYSNNSSPGGVKGVGDGPMHYNMI